jgi:putative endonuclease
MRIDTRTKGRYGEALARQWLQENGYEIITSNWQQSHYEIDIIASKENVLHLVEVKYRKSRQFGNPEESVTRKKVQCLMRAASAYLSRHYWPHVQIDVLSIIDQNKELHFYWIADVSI